MVEVSVLMNLLSTSHKGQKTAQNSDFYRTVFPVKLKSCADLIHLDVPKFMGPLRMLLLMFRYFN